jgi:hypothetical protein
MRDIIIGALIRATHEIETRTGHRIAVSAEIDPETFDAIATEYAETATARLSGLAIDPTDIERILVHRDVTLRRSRAEAAPSAGAASLVPFPPPEISVEADVTFTSDDVLEAVRGQQRGAPTVPPEGGWAAGELAELSRAILEDRDTPQGTMIIAESVITPSGIDIPLRPGMDASAIVADLKRIA